MIFLTQVPPQAFLVVQRGGPWRPVWPTRLLPSHPRSPGSHSRIQLLSSYEMVVACRVAFRFYSVLDGRSLLLRFDQSRPINAVFSSRWSGPVQKNADSYMQSFVHLCPQLYLFTMRQHTCSLWTATSWWQCIGLNR